MLVGDMFIVDLDFFDDRPPIAGDIAIYKRGGTYIVKRIIAIGGDTISSVDGIVRVNGKQLQEPYAHHTDGYYLPKWENDFGPTKVPAGKLFMMGDNRDVSLDSRAEEVGFIDYKELAGRPLYNYRPLDDRVGKEIQ